MPALPDVTCTLASAMKLGKLGDADRFDALLGTPTAGYKHAVWSIQPAAKQYEGFFVDAQTCKLVQ